MATQKQGMTVHASQWWKHLRPYCKRQFWKKQRKADKRAHHRAVVHSYTDKCTESIYITCRFGPPRRK